jgi:cardiolipin synthase
MSSKIVTIPNVLTVARMVMIPLFVTALYYQRFGLALAIFLAAGVTDGLDGLLARRFNQGSQLGQILDPIADKLLLVTSFVTLSTQAIIPKTNHLPVPFWVTAAVISRDVFIVVGAAAINIVTGFRGFRPSLLGKANTVVQLAAIVIILIAARFPVLRGYVLPTTYTTVFLLALVSGVHYAFWVSRLMNEERAQRDDAARN